MFYRTIASYALANAPTNLLVVGDHILILFQVLMKQLVSKTRLPMESILWKLMAMEEEEIIIQLELK